MVAKRAQEISAFIVMDVLEKACELECNGIDIVHLEVGERRFWGLALAAVHQELDEEPRLRVVVEPALDRMRQVAENIQRKNNTAVDLARAIAALLLHGTDDRTVFPKNSREFAARIREEGGDVTLLEYDDTGHIKIILSFAAIFRGRDTVYEDTIVFLKSL